MKKIYLLLLLLLLLTTFVSAQVLDTIPVTEKSLKWFKENYVKEKFKDPYSYQLMGHSTSVITKKQWLKRDIDFITTELENYDSYVKKDFNENVLKWISKNKYNIDYVKENYKQLIEKKSKLETEYNRIEKDYIFCYEIKIDARGSNSYGNLVLGRYLLRLTIVDNFAKPIVLRI